jgi:hypothetical protein
MPLGDRGVDKDTFMSFKYLSSGSSERLLGTVGLVTNAAPAVLGTSRSALPLG